MNKINLKSYLIGFVSCAAITGIAVGAAVIYSASDVTFTPTDNSWNATNVEEALNSLYTAKKDKESHIGDAWDFDYVGKSETFTAPMDGTYKVEVWGAAGGDATYTSGYKSAVGGYGGYSVGEIELKKDDILYVTVGGQGNSATTSCLEIVNGNGYNGGSGIACQGYNIYSSSTQNYLWGSGSGGATHIALESGLLSTFESKQDEVVIVAGGGGSSQSAASTYNANYTTNGGNGGGYVGNSGVSRTSTGDIGGTGGTQVSGGTMNSDAQAVLSQSGFGVGCKTIAESTNGGMKMGGGAGWYGGGCGRHSGGGGGSGYINYSGLENGKMYCYDCTESTGTSTYTVSNTCVNKTATSECSKQGNGYAKITLISVD